MSKQLTTLIAKRIRELKKANSWLGIERLARMFDISTRQVRNALDGQNCDDFKQVEPHRCPECGGMITTKNCVGCRL